MLVLVLAFSGFAAKTLCAKHQPSASNSTMAQAGSLLKAQRYKQAIKAFKHLNARQGNRSADCYWGMAQAYWQLEDLKKTEESCDSVLRYAGWNVHLKVLAHNLRALAAEQRGFEGEPKMFKQGEKEFQAAYELDKGYPDRAVTLFNLGIAQSRAGEAAQGIATLKDYLAQNPQGASAGQARRVIADPRLATSLVAPNFSLTALDGRTYNLEQLRGKIVLLDFWGTDAMCRPCTESLADMVYLAKKFAGTPLVMISVSYGTETRAWRAFVQAQKMNWPQYLDRNQVMRRTYAVYAFPSYILIDQDGIIVFRETGLKYTTGLLIENEIRRELAALANAKPGHPTAGSENRGKATAPSATTTLPEWE